MLFVGSELSCRFEMKLHTDYSHLSLEQIHPFFLSPLQSIFCLLSVKWGKYIEDIEIYSLKRASLPVIPPNPLHCTPWRVCWPVAFLSGMETAALQTARPYGQKCIEIVMFTYFPLSSILVFCLHNASAKPAASWRTHPSLPQSLPVSPVGKTVSESIWLCQTAQQLFPQAMKPSTPCALDSLSSSLLLAHKGNAYVYM